MNDWSRSIALLGTSFLGVVVITMGLVSVIVPRQVRSIGAAETVAPDPQAGGELLGPGEVPTELGGTLILSGDGEGTYLLRSESADMRLDFVGEAPPTVIDGRYSLTGSTGSIHFGHDPLEIEQIDLEALSFYPEPDECEITPGVLNSAIGVASAEIRCADIADIRDNGVFTVEGVVAMSADVLGMRGDLPPSGGTVEVGDTTLAFGEARLLLMPFGFDAVTGRSYHWLTADDATSALGFEYDPHTHELFPDQLALGDTLASLADAACALTLEQLGPLNPRTTVVDVSLECDAVDVPGMGSVPVRGTLTVDLIEGGD